MRDIFYCYSMRVKEFLCDNGYPFILTGYHEPVVEDIGDLLEVKL